MNKDDFAIIEKEKILNNQEKLPLVSILLPVYNVASYLEKCLLTIRNQTYVNVEIILIDDGSTDDSLDIIKKHAKEDGRIKFFSRENKGLIITRLELITLCKGKYFAFVDSDDWIETRYIECLVSAAIKYNADLVRCGDSIEFVAEGRKKYYSKVAEGQELQIAREDFAEALVPELFTTAYFNSIHSELVKAELIDEEVITSLRRRKKVSVGDDVVINCEMYKKATKVVFIGDKMYHYRKNPTSIMSTKMRLDKFEKRLYDSYMTSQAIGELNQMFQGISKELYYYYILEDIDKCINLCFEEAGNWQLKRKAIEMAQKFVTDNKMEKVDKYRYLHDKKKELIFWKKTIVVTLPFIVKHSVKKILMVINEKV